MMDAAIAVVQAKAPDFKAQLGVVLGSGVGGFVNAMQDVVKIPYEELPGFAVGNVPGHAGVLCLGRIGDCHIVCLQGRPHWYEGVTGEAFVVPMQLLAALGCQQVLITNAVGALNETYPAGSVVIIKDHINLQGRNPLVGIDQGDRDFFVGMDEAYSPAMRAELLNLAESLDLPVFAGVYAGVLGPSFETPAEIRAIATMGADIIAMSMIADVVAARYAGLEVAGISLVVNAAAGEDKPALSHALTLAGADNWGDQVAALLTAYAKNQSGAVISGGKSH